MDPARCVLGFAPHSGWAAAVALGGTVRAPAVLLRERVELADASLAGSSQPYHALEGLPIPEAQQRLAQFQAAALQLALAELRRLMARVAGSGGRPLSAGILDSSGRGGPTLEAILASHALIHTADGEHFRAALAGACGQLGVAVVRVRQHELPQHAAALLGKAERELLAAVSELGRKVGPPWGADQKSAALLAWVLLARK